MQALSSTLICTRGDGVTDKILTFLTKVWGARAHTCAYTNTHVLHNNSQYVTIPSNSFATGATGKVSYGKRSFGERSLPTALSFMCEMQRVLDYRNKQQGNQTTNFNDSYKNHRSDSYALTLRNTFEILIVKGTEKFEEIVLYQKNWLTKLHKWNRPRKWNTKKIER